MATAFTHGFVASLLTPLAPTSVPRPALIFALSLFAILPDIDILTFRFGIPYSDPFGHRGFTHSFAFAAGTAAVAASAFFRYVKPFGRSWWWLAALFFCATASHGILDAFTDSGLGVEFFWPFDYTRYFFPWRPLATPPIGIRSFFNVNAQYILINEMLWVWLPTSLIAVMLYLAKRILRA